MMAPRLKTQLLLGLSFILLAASLYGAWQAWPEGLDLRQLLPFLFSPEGLLFTGGMLLASLFRLGRFAFLVARLSDITARRAALAFPWIFMISAFSPFRIGESARFIWGERVGIPASRMLVLTGAERGFDLLLLLGLLISVSFNIPISTPAPVQAAVLLLCLALLGVFAWRFRAVLGQALAQVVRPANSLPAFMFTLGIWGIMTAAYAVALQYFVDLPLQAAVLVVALVNLGGAVAVTPGNIGVFQATVILALAMYGVDPETALEIGLVLQCIQLSVTLGMAVLGRVAATACGESRLWEPV